MLNILLFRLLDGGGMYAETNLEAFFKEPWNALSSLTFWLPVFYWLYVLWGRYSQHKFLVACMPLLFVGGLGSALFHAFRTSYFLLLLDVIPILLLMVMISGYFWFKVLPNLLHLSLLVTGYVGLSLLVWHFTPPSLTINVSYLMRGIMLFLPAVFLLRKIQFKGTAILTWAIFWFILALVFRGTDKYILVKDVLPMGSHWLWHIAAAIGGFYLASFLYHLPKWEQEKLTIA